MLALALCFGASSACGSPTSDQTAGTTTAPERDTLIAQVASYDLAAEGPQRFMVGLQTDDNKLVSFGKATFEFRYEGTKQGAAAAEPGLRTEATWIPVAGQKIAAGNAPQVVSHAKGVGVYEATGVMFGKAGFWTVSVSVDIGAERHTADASFEVLAEHQIPAAGDDAPPSVNKLAGDTTVKARAIDSRALNTDKVPDPELHALTVADAIASGKPTIIVVSTPTYCVSKFCGPITESITELATSRGSAANFIHLEVWNDRDNNALNKAAADWIFPEGVEDPREPWVFLLGKDGKVAQRWDNVASDASLATALDDAIAGGER